MERVNIRHVGSTSSVLQPEGAASGVGADVVLLLLGVKTTGGVLDWTGKLRLVSVDGQE